MQQGPGSCPKALTTIGLGIVSGMRAWSVIWLGIGVGLKALPVLEMGSRPCTDSCTQKRGAEDPNPSAWELQIALRSEAEALLTCVLASQPRVPRRLHADHI